MVGEDPPRLLGWDKLDEQAAQQQMEAARGPSAKSPESMTAREQAIVQGRAQLRMARRV